jgi:ABC-type Fe3+ transport system permease subunit
MVGTVLANPQVRGEFAISSFRAALLGRTLLYNGSAAAIATIMGIPAGYVLGRGRGTSSKILWVLLPAALLMPSLSYAYGWSQFVRIIRPALRPYHIYFRPNGPADVFRCIWSLAAWLWAVPAGLIGLALRRMDTSVQQQALLDGALRRVTFRQLLGPIIASIAIVTILATQEFAVYEPTGISVVATEVRMVFDTGSMSSVTNLIAAPGQIGAGLHSTDQPQRAAAAVATAAPLLAVTILLALLAAWGAGRAAASDALAVGDWPRVLDASRWTVSLTWLLVVLNIGIPVAALIASLRINLSALHMYEEFAPQLQGAMLVAIEATAVALVAAFSAGGRWIRGSLALAGASFLIGGQLLAIALIRIWNRPGLAWGYDCSVVPVIAYLGRFGWLTMAAARGTWSPAWREMRDVASADGAGAFRTALFVIWPLAWPTLLAGGLMVGALSLTEVPATVLLLPQHPQVLTPTLMTWVHMARFDPMIEASLLMMAAVLLPALSAVVLTALGLKALRVATPETRATLLRGQTTT